MAINNSGNNFKIKFNSSNNTYSKIGFSKTQNNFEPKTEVTPVEKDIYYDEVIYYDGGDAKGYGND